MSTRTQRKDVVHSQPFRLMGVDGKVLLGDCRVVTDEDLIEGLSFPVYRRLSTMIFLPAQSHHLSSVEMTAIDPLDLPGAQDRDAAAHQRRRGQLTATKT